MSGGTNDDDVVRSLGHRWPPPSTPHVTDDTWGPSSDHGTAATGHLGHLGQLTINTGWNSATLPQHTEVSNCPRIISVADADNMNLSLFP